MKIALIRHGKTNYNEKHLCNYDPNVDVHLTDSGKHGVHVLAVRLKNADFKRIYVSELPRTKATAEILNAYHRVPITIDSRLDDNRTGFEGRSVDEYYRALAAQPDIMTARFNEGEALKDVQQRVWSFLNWVHDSGEESVAIVTSMIIVQTIFGLLHDLTFEQQHAFAVDNAACFHLELP